MKKVAIVGSTGMLGQSVTKAFVQAGFDVTVLVRDVGKANQYFDSSVKVIRGDLRDMNAIRQAFREQDAIYLNLSVDPNSAEKAFQPERDGLDNILLVARECGIKRIGFLSSLVRLYQGMNGFNWWVFDIKHKALTKIKNSGITFSIFYPSTFMESFDKGAYRQGNNLMLAGESRHKMFLIAGADYGIQVVKAYQLNNGNQEYVVQGQEGFTADEAARLLVENYRKASVRIIKMPFGLLKFMGRFTNKFNYGAHIIEALNNYPEKFEAETTWQTLGKPQTRFVDYIRHD